METTQFEHGGCALQEASHQLVMITGDTPLTACHAAKQVHIVDRPILILDHHRFAHPFNSEKFLLSRHQHVTVDMFAHRAVVLLSCWQRFP